MSCKWGHEDCKNVDEKCYLCNSVDFHYDPVKVKKYGLKKHAQKEDKRMGSGFEYKNHVKNEAILSASSSMTLNSGATVLQKGDEQIRGIVNIMEELKTKVVEQAPGKKTFTIQKKWLDKLHREALAEHMEFWYLKFAFHEFDNDIYCITEQDIIMSMVKTMVEDRKAVNVEKHKAAIAEKQRRVFEAENIKLQAEIDLLKEQLKGDGNDAL